MFSVVTERVASVQAGSVGAAGMAARPALIADGSSPDLAPLLAGALLPLLRLDESAEPLSDITSHLQQLRRSGQAATTLHLLAHGQPGVVQLAGRAIDRAALIAAAPALATWGVQHIVLWSCHTGADQAFTSTLAELTGAAVHATSGLIGSGHALSLASATGEVLSLSALFQPEAIARWGGTLTNQYDAAGKQFNFNSDPGRRELLTTGTGGALGVGARHLFKNVVTVQNSAGQDVAIDAILTVENLQRATIIDLDSSTEEYNVNELSAAAGFLQPEISFASSTNPSIKGGCADFEIQFIEDFDSTTGTGKPVILNNVNVDLYDIDGNDFTARQYVEVDDVGGYAISSGALIGVESTDDGIRFKANNTDYGPTAPGYTRPGANVKGIPGAPSIESGEEGVATGDLVRAQLRYKTGLSNFRFQLGDSNYYNSRSYRAYFSLNFGSTLPFSNIDEYGITANSAVVSECGSEAAITVAINGPSAKPPTSTVKVDLLDYLTKNPLGSLPTVVVNADGSATINDEIRLSTTQLVFTVNDPDAATHWTKPQTIQVTGLNDAALDGNFTFEGLLFATSADPYYNKLSDFISAANNDNDTTISGVSLLRSESEATFSVTAASGRTLQLTAVDGTTSGIASAPISISTDAGENWIPYTGSFTVPGDDTATFLVRVGVTPTNLNAAAATNTFDLQVTSPDVPCPVRATATILPLSSLGDRVWHDSNANGQQDAGEAGVADVAVELYASVDGLPTGSALSSTTTDASGNYLFSDLQPGAYAVKFLTPEGSWLTRPDEGADSSDSDAAANGFSDEILLARGQSDLTIDAGLIRPSSISGAVYHDLNNNGVRDPGEAPIAGTTVTLSGTDDLGNPVSTTATTDVNGLYAFTNLRPGTYSVTETQPAGWNDGKDAVGTSGGTLANDAISAITLPSGVDATDYNFGELLPAPPPPVDPIVAPGVRTPGFWVNPTWMTFWDGVIGNEPRQCGTKGFVKGDLLAAPYKTGTPGSVVDPVSGNSLAGVLVGDWNRNGQTDTNEQTLFYSTREAQLIMNSSLQPSSNDVRYTLGRSLVASWLNYVAGNPVDTARAGDRDARSWINNGINWLQTNTPDENADLRGDGMLHRLSSLSSPAMKASNPAWKATPLGGQLTHTSLDSYNNGNALLADGVFHGGI